MNELRSLTNGLYTADQNALNVLTTSRIERMLEKNRSQSTTAVARLIDEGKIMQDYVAPLGVHLKAKEKNPVITFGHNGTVKMLFNDKEFSLHDNAISQLAAKLNVPAAYLRQLAAGDEWQRGLASKIMNDHSEWTDRSRVLVRSVGSEVRGVLSDHYRRLNTMDIITAFLQEVEKAGGMLADGTADSTKFWFETIHPEPIIIPTIKNGDVSLAFGARITSSDYGDGSLQISSFILQGICLNGMVRESALRQVHLGGRLPDNIQLSERTYRYDTMTMASAVKDLTKQLYSPDVIFQKATEVQRASEMDLDINRELKALQKTNLSKQEVKEVEEVLVQGNPDDGVKGEATLWKLINGVTAVARDKEPRRKREMQEVAGKLMERVSK